ncbi:MAG: hypothetical protein R3F24_03440 [Gammaproteobacteria bacterium]
MAMPGPIKSATGITNHSETDPPERRTDCPPGPPELGQDEIDGVVEKLGRIVDRRDQLQAVDTSAVVLMAHPMDKCSSACEPMK